MFNDLMFGRREPVYVAFDVLFVEGEDVRIAPLKERKALLANIVRRYRLQKFEPVLGEGVAAFKAVCGLDLEGIVAKRLADSYGPRTQWWKILNRVRRLAGLSCSSSDTVRHRLAASHAHLGPAPAGLFFSRFPLASQWRFLGSTTSVVRPYILDLIGKIIRTPNFQTSVEMAGGGVRASRGSWRRAAALFTGEPLSRAVEVTLREHPNPDTFPQLGWRA